MTNHNYREITINASKKKKQSVKSIITKSEVTFKKFVITNKLIQNNLCKYINYF